MDHQDVIGTVNPKVWQHLVLAFAEAWPNIPYTAQALGCLDITTRCVFRSAKSKVEFASTRLGSTLKGGIISSSTKVLYQST